MKDKPVVANDTSFAVTECFRSQSPEKRRDFVQAMVDSYLLLRLQL